MHRVSTTGTWLSPHPGETIAYSGHCEQDQHGRPIAAHFNWSPRHLPDAADRWTTHYLVRVAMHELTHALVFSAPLLDQFPGVGGARSHCPLVLTVARYHPSHSRDAPPLRRCHHDLAHPERRRGLGDTHAARASRHARALRLPEPPGCAPSSCRVAAWPATRRAQAAALLCPGCSPIVSRRAAGGRRRGGDCGVPLGDAMVQRRVHDRFCLAQR